MMSKYEGWGLTLCEAMSQGSVPIVLNSFSAAQDIIKDGINGFLVPNEQVGYQRLLELMHKPQQLVDMGMQAVIYTKKGKGKATSSTGGLASSLLYSLLK